MRKDDLYSFLGNDQGGDLLDSSFNRVGYGIRNYDGSISVYGEDGTWQGQVMGNMLYSTDMEFEGFVNVQDPGQ